MKPSFASALLALGAFLCSQIPFLAAPNIIVILADDAGYADFGYQIGGIDGDFNGLTPNIDSIATGGVKFSNGYSSCSVCCPSRAGLLTGRYQNRYGMEVNLGSELNAGLPTTEKTMANTLRPHWVTSRNRASGSIVVDSRP